MDTIFMNFQNSKTSDLHRLLLSTSGKTNLKSMDKYFGLSNLSIYNTWKISAPKWNSDILDYFEYIIKKHGTATDNL